jgi:hypothetical protein
MPRIHLALPLILVVGLLSLPDSIGAQVSGDGMTNQAARVMQRCLSALGYDTGGVTGTWNTQTELMAFRYASSKGLNPYTDGYRVGQLLVLDCVTRAVQLNDQAMLAEISRLGNTLTPADPGESVAAMQRCLRDMGFDPGPIDGIKGRRTEEALMRWAGRRQLLGSDHMPNEITALFMADCARTMTGPFPPSPVTPQLPLHTR